MSKKVTTLVEESITPVAKEMGYEIVEVEYAKKYNGMNLTIFLDKEGGITLDDCEAFSKKIDPILEELNPTNDESYILNISSPGIDRPLKNEKDFNRNLNKEITLKFYASIDGKKETCGVLKDFSNSSITINENGINKTYELSKISQILPIIKL